MIVKSVVRCLALTLVVAGCAAHQTPFIASSKSPAELRAMQVRVVPGDANDVMRSVIATMQDLGYRLTKADADAGTVSGMRGANLRLAATVRARADNESVIRANAVVLIPGKEVQVDAPQFYAADFFQPLQATIGRQLANAGPDVVAPEEAMPAVEKNLPTDRDDTKPKVSKN